MATGRAFFFVLSRLRLCVLGFPINLQRPIAIRAEQIGLMPIAAG